MTRVLALDCGGSKTAAVMVEDGIVVARGEQPGANLFTHGPDAIARVACQAMERLPGAHALVIAAAGVRGGPERSRVITASRSCGIDIPLAVYSDARAALRAAAIQAGVVVIAGTGSAALAIGPDGQERRAGGWGSAVGDEGSGAWLGHRMVAAVVRAYDEGHDRAALRDAVLDSLRLGAVPDLRGLSSAPPATFATLVPALGQLHSTGDATAMALVDDAVHELARLVKVAVAGTGLAAPVPVVLVGGLTTAIIDLPVLLQGCLGDEYDVRVLTEEPAVGAYLLATEDGQWDTSSGRAALPTEAVNPVSEGIDQRPAIEIVRIMNQEDAGVPAAVAGSLHEIARLVDAAADRMRNGGRLIYLGAGTSGRLAALDAAECVPTFGAMPGQVMAIIAGGPEALARAVEGAEDDGPAGVRALAEVGPTSADVVVGISASGRAAFVRQGVAEARRRGSYTAFITCGGISVPADVVVSVAVGPEVIAGSTRLKAGTAQKLVLNMVSTAVMIRLRRTLGNRMIKMRPANAELRERAIGLVASLSGRDEAAAVAALERSGWDVATAALLARLGSDEAVHTELARFGGDARAALRSQGKR